MSEIVERVARALCAQEYDDNFALVEEGDRPPRAQWIRDYWRHSIPLARTAIEAMAVPNDAMVEAALSAWRERINARIGNGALLKTGFDPSVPLKDNWRAMITAALSEDTGTGRMPIYSGKNVD